MEYSIEKTMIIDLKTNDISNLSFMINNLEDISVEEIDKHGIKCNFTKSLILLLSDHGYIEDNFKEKLLEVSNKNKKFTHILINSNRIKTLKGD